MPSTVFLRRVLFALLLAITLAGVGRAAPPTTVAGKDAFAPFDLTYLPPTVTTGIVAFRPAALARHLPEHPLAGQAHQFLGLLLTMMTDCDPSAAKFPALADIDECILGLNLSTTFPSPGKQGTFVFGAGSPGSVRTTKPFDWEGSVRKWCPRATKAEHAGRAYFRTPWKTNSPLIPADVAKKAEGRCLGIFIPDNRTLVLGDEEQIQELIDRLKQGKSIPE